MGSEVYQDRKELDKPKISPREKALLLVIFIFLLGGIGYSYWQGYFALVIQPAGLILNPTENTVTETKVSVSGYTRSVVRGNYIWLVVDKNKYRQCWPKTPVSTLNDTFSENIWEGGPLEEPYTLSLYAVDKLINDRWLAGLAKKQYNGLPMPSGKRRLHSVALVKGKQAAPRKPRKAMPVKILVTGGAGFIGSHLCDHLIDMGHQVICADNFSTGTRQNIAHLLDCPGFQVLDHDITMPLEVDVAANQIYNLACPASPVMYQADPLQTTKTAVLGAINMLDLALKLKCPVLQASTSEIYGDPQEHPQPETYCGNVNPIGPRACYDEGKRCAESLFFDYHRQHGVRIKIARIFNTYGPRMHPEDGRVISNFISQALCRQALTISGTGEQTRSFCYVDDMVDGLIRLMNAPAHVTGPINLGNPEEISIRDLAEKIIHLTQSGSRTVFHRMPADDPRRRKPDIALAEQQLGWQPASTLEKGLKQTIQWFQMHQQRSGHEDV